MFCFDYCLLSIVVSSFVQCWWLFLLFIFDCCFILWMRSPATLGFTVFPSGDNPHKQGMRRPQYFLWLKAFLSVCLKVRVLPVALGRGERLETGNSPHWPMIQSKFLFSETVRRIHKCGDSESFSAVKTARWWCERVLCSQTWLLPTAPLPLCLAHLLILVCLEISLITRCDPYLRDRSTCHQAD